MGCLLFRIDRHGKSEHIPHLICLNAVFRIPDPADRCKLRIHAVRCHARKHVYLIHIRRRNKKFRVLHACCFQYRHAGGVAGNGNHIIFFHHIFKDSGAAVDDCQFVSFVGELFSEAGTDFSSSGNQNLHTCQNLR